MPLDTIKSKKQAIRLWVHECSRVFFDRLSDKKE